MKKISIIVLLFCMVGCSSESSIYTKEEVSKLKELGIYEEVEKDCANPTSISIMLQDDFKAAYANSYCALSLEISKSVNALLDAKVSNEDLLTYKSISYMNDSKIDRYVAYDAPTVEEKVLAVNMNLDLKPYEEVSIIENTSDVTMLVNKYNTLPEGYVPDGLREIKYQCTRGVDYSCTLMNSMQLQKDAADAFEAFVEGMRSKDIDIVAIATYRDYAYQKNLHSYYANTNGLEYADTYYARPGQSEHNSGLAVDITFNGHTFNEIEHAEGYDKILEDMHTYGFILRYPEGKEEVTLYGHESWHLRYVGVELATKLYESGDTLEEYYGRLGS